MSWEKRAFLESLLFEYGTIIAKVACIVAFAKLKYRAYWRERKQLSHDSCHIGCCTWLCTLQMVIFCHLPVRSVEDHIAD